MRLVDLYAELLAYAAHLAGTHPEREVSYEEASGRFEGLFARAETLRAREKFTDEQWREGLFAVCAFIDETILCSDWPERLKWQTAQLQHRFFNTTNAGEEFFDLLGAISPDDIQVREVYGYCLAMGFKGKYFRPEDGGQLEETARSNQGLLKRGGEQEGIAHMFPDAYGADRKDRRKSGLATSIFTLAICIIPVLVFIGLFFLYNRMLQSLLAGYFL